MPDGVCYLSLVLLTQSLVLSLCPCPSPHLTNFICNSLADLRISYPIHRHCRRFFPFLCSALCRLVFFWVVATAAATVDAVRGFLIRVVWNCNSLARVYRFCHTVSVTLSLLREPLCLLRTVLLQTRLHRSSWEYRRFRSLYINDYSYICDPFRFGCHAAGQMQREVGVEWVNGSKLTMGASLLFAPYWTRNRIIRGNSVQTVSVDKY